MTIFLMGCTVENFENGVNVTYEVTPESFVEGLNNIDSGYLPTNYIEKSIYKTERNGFFVYYDGLYDEYVAVNLSYLIALQYSFSYATNYDVANEFRIIQDDDEYEFSYIGDYYGDNYEIVDISYFDYNTNEDVFKGYVTGSFY